MSGVTGGRRKRIVARIEAPTLVGNSDSRNHDTAPTRRPTCSRTRTQFVHLGDKSPVPWRSAQNLTFDAKVGLSRCLVSVGSVGIDMVVVVDGRRRRRGGGRHDHRAVYVREHGDDASEQPAPRSSCASLRSLRSCHDVKRCRAVHGFATRDILTVVAVRLRQRPAPSAMFLTTDSAARVS